MKKCQKCFAVLADHAARCHCGEDLMSAPQLSEKDLKRLYIRFPFLWIFFQPKKTTLHILEYYKPLSSCIVLFIAYLIQLPKTYELIAKFNPKQYLPRSLLGYSELTYLGIGFIAFLLSFYIFAVLVSVTGRWINGKGNITNIFMILTWSSIPFFIIPLLEFIFPLILKDYSTSLLVVTSLLTIWGFLIQIICVSVAHNFSTAKVILNSLFAIFLISFIGSLVIFGVLYLGKNLSQLSSGSSYRTITPDSLP